MLPSVVTEQLGARIPAAIIWARKSSASSRPEGWVSEFVRLCSIEGASACIRACVRLCTVEEVVIARDGTHHVRGVR